MIQAESSIVSSEREMAAFRDFFMAEHLRVRRFLRLCGFSTESAEDATQEAFMRAFTSWVSILNPPMWIRTVALREARRRSARSMREWPVGQAGELAQLGPELRAAPDLENVEEALSALNLLRQLPEAQAAVLALDLDGFNVHEIAEILGTRMATVRSNRRHALVRLRRIMEEEQLFPSGPGRQAH